MMINDDMLFFYFCASDSHNLSLATLSASGMPSLTDPLIPSFVPSSLSTSLHHFQPQWLGPGSFPANSSGYLYQFVFISLDPPFIYMHHPVTFCVLLTLVFAAERSSAHTVQIEDRSDRLILDFITFRYHPYSFGCLFHACGFTLLFSSFHSSYS